MDNTNTSEGIKYPTDPDVDGFFVESKQDSDYSIFTKVYENGNKVKRSTLPRSDKVAILRELKASDQTRITRFMGEDPEKYQMAAITVATKFDGSDLPIEMVAELKMKDYVVLATMYQGLNF